MKNAKFELFIYESIDEMRELINDCQYQKAIEKADSLLPELSETIEYGEYYIAITKLLALCYRKDDMCEKAIDTLQKAIIYCKKKYLKHGDLNNYREYAILTVNLGIVYEVQKEYAMAIGEYRNALLIFKNIEDIESQYKLYITMCSTFIAIDEINKAQEILNDSILLAEKNDLVYDKTVISMLNEKIKEKNNE